MQTIILLAVCVSLDSLSTGMAYASSGIQIPRNTKITIAIINGLVTLIAVAAGGYMCCIIPDVSLRLAGGGILAGLGGRTLWDTWKNREAKSFDFDNSKVLDPKEGVLIGLSMAFDSMSAGISIAGSGALSFVFPVLTALAGTAFLSIGNFIKINMRRINCLGGIILILLGLLRCFCS